MRTLALIAAFALTVGNIAFGESSKQTDGPQVIVDTAAHASSLPAADESLPQEDQDTDASLEIEMDPAVLPAIGEVTAELTANLRWRHANERRDDEFRPAPDPRPPRA